MLVPLGNVEAKVLLGQDIVDDDLVDALLRGRGASVHAGIRKDLNKPIQLALVGFKGTRLEVDDEHAVVVLNHNVILSYEGRGEVGIVVDQ